MKNIIRHTLRGCGNLHTCGEHPGTVMLFTFILMGALAAGGHGGWKGSIFGAGMMSLFIAPLYLYGAYERSVIDEKHLPKYDR